jgi:tRNA A37 threonylcarbamoyladenosine synthetase subunit TsaC/SUA5/YrdC
VLRRRAALSWELGEPADTIGVRVAAHPLIRALTERVGPIAATSANRHGSDPAVSAEDARRQLGPNLVVVDGGRLGTVASTVVDATREPWKVLRVGAVSAEELDAAGAPL